MNKSTLKALKGSIAKWEGVVAGTIEEQGWINCPLCKKFFGHGKNCNGCPIKEATGLSGCRSTPYEKFSNLINPQFLDNGIWTLSKAGKRHAQAELDFLKSLLPKDEA